MLGKPGAGADQIPAFSEGALTVATLPMTPVELKVKSSAIAPGMEYFPWLAHDRVGKAVYGRMASALQLLETAYVIEGQDTSKRGWNTLPLP